MIKDHDIPEIKSFVVRKNKQTVPGFSVEYFEIVDDTELIPVSTKAEMKKGKTIFWMHCSKGRKNTADR